eukprot:TRINITY_DN54830_c0_g1_i1.p1 TRINITY_DN54830_c0_g1~~TRINITY_DN54830_c0_g1_i1.p1  ORF type:complete len:659 (-),score=103.39 TRINITY_DN54830_c0_g1_i1:162-1934(-)
MTTWALKGHAEGKTCIGKDWCIVHTVIVAFWTIFFVFLVLRIISLICWRKRLMRASVCSALFMFSSSFQYALYVALYFILRNRLGYVSVNNKAFVKYEPNADGSAYVGSCTKAYEAEPVCDHKTFVGGSACCVQSIGKLKRAGEEFFGLPVTKAMMIFQLIAVLLSAFVWHEMPLLPATSFDKDFLKGVWLDILDCFIFGQFIMRSDVVYPFFGMVGTPREHLGRPCDSGVAVCSDKLYFLVFVFWGIAFASSFIGPAIFVCLHFLEDTHNSKDTLDEVTADLMHSIRLLSHRRASKLLQETFSRQLEKYIDAEGENPTHRVRVLGTNTDVHSSDSDGSDGDERLRAGMARLEGHGFYRVEFDDEQEPSEVVVPVSQIRPSIPSAPRMCGHKCCSGWLSTKSLYPEHEKEGFVRKAEFLEAIRSLFLLELPFFIFRFLFIFIHGPLTDLLSGTSFFFFKNSIWIILDSMTILSCANDSAFCCSMKPISFLKNFIKGTKLTKSWFGPSGVFRIIIEMTDQGQKAYTKMERNHLEAYRAWLIVEMEKGKMRDAYGNSLNHTSDSMLSYQEEIDRVEEEIKNFDVTLVTEWWK